MPRRLLVIALGLFLGAGSLAAAAAPQPALPGKGSFRIVAVPAGAETVPVPDGGDAADDPAIWVDHAHPGRSLVLGNDKLGALETYNLDGSVRQTVTTGVRFWGNVDVRQSVKIGGSTYDTRTTKTTRRTSCSPDFSRSQIRFFRTSHRSSRNCTPTASLSKS